MRTLALAFGSSLATSVVFYAILAASGLGENALHIALIPLLGTSHLYELIEKTQTKRRSSVTPAAIVTFEGFAIPWYVMIVYGGVIFVGISEGAGVIGSLMANQVTSAGDSVADHVVIMKVVQWPLLLLGLYLLGFWIGSRCVARGVIATIGSLYLGSALVLLLDWTVIPPAIFETYHGRFKDIIPSIPSIAISSVRPLVFALLGFWRGSRTRLSKYLRYLLAVLPPETRTTIVNLAYEEAQAAADKQAHC